MSSQPATTTLPLDSRSDDADLRQTKVSLLEQLDHQQRLGKRLLKTYTMEDDIEAMNYQLECCKMDLNDPRLSTMGSHATDSCDATTIAAAAAAAASAASIIIASTNNYPIPWEEYDWGAIVYYNS